MCYGCLKALLEKLNENSRTSLYALAYKWLHDVSKVQKQFLAAQVIGAFAEVEKELFAARVDDLMPVFIKMIQPKADQVRHNTQYRYTKYSFTNQYQCLRLEVIKIIYIFNVSII